MNARADPTPRRGAGRPQSRPRRAVAVGMAVGAAVLALAGTAPRAAAAAESPAAVGIFRPAAVMAGAGLEPRGEAWVAAVIDGDTVTTAGHGDIRLVGVQAPKLPLGRTGFAAWPLAGEARAALDALVGGRAVHLFAGARDRDRHGRLLAHLMVGPGESGAGTTGMATQDGGLWVQGTLVASGWARAYSFPDNRALIGELLALEENARQARRGIWAEEFYRVRGADDLARLDNTFQLVEAVPVRAASVRGTVYVNFGPDWKTDFTVRITGRALSSFRRAGLDPLTLAGKRIRVRGWIDRYNGPMIDATHPEQIELLDRP